MSLSRCTAGDTGFSQVLSKLIQNMIARFSLWLLSGSMVPSRMIQKPSTTLHAGSGAISGFKSGHSHSSLKMAGNLLKYPGSPWFLYHSGKLLPFDWVEEKLAAKCSLSGSQIMCKLLNSPRNFHQLMLPVPPRKLLSHSGLTERQFLNLALKLWTAG